MRGCATKYFECRAASKQDEKTVKSEEARDWRIAEERRGKRRKKDEETKLKANRVAVMP